MIDYRTVTDGGAPDLHFDFFSISVTFFFHFFVRMIPTWYIHSASVRYLRVLCIAR